MAKKKAAKKKAAKKPPAKKPQAKKAPAKKAKKAPTKKAPAKKAKKATAKKARPAAWDDRAAVDRRRAEGDAHMAAGRYREADEAYVAAWPLVAVADGIDAYGEDAAFWLLLSGLDAQHRLGEHEDVVDTGSLIFELFPRLAVGNPFFHLRVGQALFALADGEELEDAHPAVDELARALICGGIDLFDGEPPEHRALVVERLRPPAGHASWDATSTRLHGVDESCSRDRLNGAPPYLAAELAKKFGAPPPYAGP